MKFKERCYRLLKKVPSGRVSSYREIARALGVFGGARAVGNAMNKSPGWKKGVNCHRVVCSDGKLGGFAFGVREKIKLLRKDGVEVVDGRVNLDKYLYKFR